MTKLHRITSQQELLDGTIWRLKEILNSDILQEEKDDYQKKYDFFKEILLSGKIEKSEESQDLRTELLLQYLFPIYEKYQKLSNYDKEEEGLAIIFCFAPIKWRFWYHDFWTDRRLIEAYEESIDYWTKSSFENLGALSRYRREFGDKIYDEYQKELIR